MQKKCLYLGIPRSYAKDFTTTLLDTSEYSLDVFLTQTQKAIERYHLVKNELAITFDIKTYNTEQGYIVIVVYAQLSVDTILDLVEEQSDVHNIDISKIGCYWIDSSEKVVIPIIINQDLVPENMVSLTPNDHKLLDNVTIIRTNASKITTSSGYEYSVDNKVFVNLSKKFWKDKITELI